MIRNIFDLPHVKSVRAWALVHKGRLAGKIVANYSDNPAGSVCTAQVILWTGPLADKPGQLKMEKPPLGKAGGYGYDKFSAAVSESLRKLGFDPGDSEVKDFMEKHGYVVMEVC